MSVSYGFSHNTNDTPTAGESNSPAESSQVGWKPTAHEVHFSELWVSCWIHEDCLRYPL